MTTAPTFTPDPSRQENLETEAEARRAGYFCRVQDPAGCTSPGPYSSTKARGSHEYHHKQRLAKESDGPLQLGRPDADGDQTETPAGAPVTSAPRASQFTRAEIGRISAGLSWENLSERTKLFAEALDATVESDYRKEKRRQVIEAFEEDSSELTKDSHNLENFLDDFGLTLPQIRRITRRLISRGQRQNNAVPGYPGAAQQVLAVDPRTGQSIPVIVINPQFPAADGGRDRQPQMPVVIQAPAREETLTRKDVLDLLDEYFKRKEPPKAPEPVPMRRYQEVVTDHEGDWVIDNDGRPVMRWVEEPVGMAKDPIDQVFKLFSQVQRMTQPKGDPTPAPAQSPISLEDVRRMVKEEAAPRADMVTPSEASLREKVADLNARIEGREMAETTAKEVADRLVAQYQPELNRLRDAQSRGGETEVQAQLRHEETMLREFRSTIFDATDGIRQEVQPLVKLAVSAQLRGMGMGEQTIADIMKAPQAGQVNTAAEARRAAAVRAQYEK